MEQKDCKKQINWKRILPIIGILAAGILTILFLVFSYGIKNIKNKNLFEDYQATANDDPFLKDMGYVRSEINIDAVLDDAQWEGLQELTYSNKTSTNIKAFYGENGIYIGAVTKDSDLSGNNTDALKNSCLIIYIDTLGTGLRTVTDGHMAIYLDVAGHTVLKVGREGKWHTSSTEGDKTIAGNTTIYAVESAVKVNGTLDDEQADEGYVVEAFIPYMLLGGKTDVDYRMGFGTFGCEKSIKKSTAVSKGLISVCPITYHIFQRSDNRFVERQKVNYATYKVDGKDNDTIWQNRTKYSFANGLVSVSNYFAKEGLYFFFDVKDDKVYANDAQDGNGSWDDCLMVFLDVKKDGGEKPQPDDAYITADAAGNIKLNFGTGTGSWSEIGDNIISGIQVINGKLGGKADGYALELFIPWSDIGLEAAPKEMKVNFSLLDWDGAITSDGKRTSKRYGTGSMTAVPDEWFSITKSAIDGETPKSEIKLDGVFDDKLWESSKLSLFFGGSVKIRWKWTNSGCYVGYDVSDGYVKTSDSAARFNSAVELYLDYQGDGGDLNTGNRYYIADAAGNIIASEGENYAWSSIGTKVQSGVIKTEGGYALELYVPWAEFKSGKPEKMGVAFGKIEYWSETDTKRWVRDDYCKNPHNPALYSVFTENEIIDTPGNIAYSSSKLKGLLGLGAWYEGVKFDNLKVVTTAGKTKTWTFDSVHQGKDFTFYKKDTAKNDLTIGNGWLYSSGETVSDTHTKAIVNEQLDVKSVSVDLHPTSNGKINGCIYLGAKGSIAGGVLANPAIAIQVSDINADSEVLTLKVSEFQDYNTLQYKSYSIENGNALYTTQKAQPMRLTVDVDGTKLTIRLSLISDASKFVQTFVDIANY